MKPIEKATQLKIELDDLRPLKKEDELRVMQKLRLDWNFHSSSLEGNALSFAETKALILFGLTAANKPLSEHLEMKNHDEAVKYIIEIAKSEQSITEDFIKKLHSLILKAAYFVEETAADGQITRKKINVGVYKSLPNHIQTATGEAFWFATPDETPAKMQELIAWYDEKVADVPMTNNAIVLAAQFYHKFIRICPFDAGNGRVARLLMNFILMRFGFPPVIIKQEDKRRYFEVLQLADAGNLEVFIHYIAENAIDSLKTNIKAAKGKNIEDDTDDLDKALAILEQKINYVGEEINTIKNQKVLETLFDESIVFLVEKYVDKSEKMAKFYKYKYFTFFINERERVGARNRETAIDVILTTAKRMISEFTVSMNLSYSFSFFEKHGFEAFSFYSYLKLSFAKTKYKISTKDDYYMIEKYYNEQLTEREINNLVKAEIKRHTQFIEQKISEMRK